ncbi:Undecaprenyl-diphosphatase [Hoyosella subflava DQS3-9A1]|uniref:Undecaprenyl-diphosphatase n=2 Tax=Hoyosella TaxID=697025 RepID=F6END4_HOYSD|nr:Undecaprenyl-diphosphatase [Hoyosella subflava DQS3-9A1]
MTFALAQGGDAAIEHMTWLQVIVLAIIQGLTEFLPISSSGHLRLADELLFGADAGASFTAVSQIGTEAAVIVFFARDIYNIVVAWFRGLFNRAERDVFEYKLGWYVIIASLPIGVLGFIFRDEVRTGARNLWIISSMFIFAGLLLAAAEYWGRKKRHMTELRMRDAVVMGVAQAGALVPGVSRSGGTITAGLAMGLSRYAAARFSFLLAIPAVVASGVFSLPDAFNPAGDGLAASGMQLVVTTVITFIVGYACIAWFLKFVQHYSMYWFVGYRVVVGLLIMGLLAGGVISAT